MFEGELRVTVSISEIWKRSLLLFTFLFLPCTVFAGGFEIPIEALLGSKKALLEWKSPFQKWYQHEIDSITGFSPLSHTELKQERFKGLTLSTVQFVYPPESPLFGKPGGGVLVIPEKIDKKRPIIVAIHGHETSPWGQHPINLFKGQQWPFEMAKAGYVVWAPVSMYHEEIKTVAEGKGYPLTWVKIISDGIDYGQRHLWNAQAGTGYVVAGLSAGGQISYSLMAFRSDIQLGIFAGAEQDINFLRREYRINGHPNCWEIKDIESFTAIQALLAPRPVQFQSGKQDPFHPNGKPLKKEGDWFPGTSRAQFSTEVGGNALALRSLYEIYNKRNNFSFLIHAGGHEMRTDAALRFIRSHGSSG